MTDDTPPAPPPARDGSSERARVEAPPHRTKFDALPVLYLLGFVVLAGALVYLYRHPSLPPGVAADTRQVAGVQQQVQSLTERLARLEARPAPAAAPAPNLAPLEARIAELEKRPAPTQAAPPNLAPLETRLAELERRPAPPPPADTAPLAARIAELERRPQPDLAPLTRRIETLDGSIRTAGQAQATRLDQLDSRLGAVEALANRTASAQDAVAQRARMAGRLQAAAAALAAGQKLGDIPGAPPAIARFATEAPPTEAALRLSFNQAAEAAQRASQPALMDDQPFASRLWNRAQQVVTVRQGDRVLLGDPIAGVLARARESVEAGDLKGALTALEGLAGPAAAAMASWVAQARALLEARAALAGLAAG